MTVVYGKIETLKRIRDTLSSEGITRFNSIADINEFHRNYEAEKLRINRHVEDQSKLEIELLESLRDTLQKKYDDQKDAALKEHLERHKNFEQRIDRIRFKDTSHFILTGFHRLQLKTLNYRQNRLVKGHEKTIKRKTILVFQELERTKADIKKLTVNKAKIIVERSSEKLQDMERIQDVLEELNPLIAGAIGENKVQKELEKLPDNNVLFNDFSLRFDKPVYNRKEKDKIFSIQIDHLLVTNAGIFIIETKYWSRESLKSLDLRSPVKQIRRTSFALFVVLNNSDNAEIGLSQHHWGHKQIPIKNIVVMINEKPKERFKYVQVKRLNELNSYITYFEPIFDDLEVARIAEYLNEMRQDLGDIDQRPRSGSIENQVSKRGSTNYGLRAWIKKNPGKGINDYYREFSGQ